ncbi:UNKNOWN [Stylonychia lemnae]|uniref:Polymerase nucleotidyl transferase domain-containing protein n=1 Tax=Stylonychia lemnae TaxID=5949 RepID=A0A077ZQN4_STYLE|nr:UNKNOWN [Stylonychia lemnae]|eukprot:CDW72233.1 UNKNOWN [Stylonychia lemnae]
MQLNHSTCFIQARSNIPSNDVKNYGTDSSFEPLIEQHLNVDQLNHHREFNQSQLVSQKQVERHQTCNNSSVLDFVSDTQKHEEDQQELLEVNQIQQQKVRQINNKTNLLLTTHSNLKQLKVSDSMMSATSQFINKSTMLRQLYAVQTQTYNSKSQVQSTLIGRQQHLNNKEEYNNDFYQQKYQADKMSVPLLKSNDTIQINSNRLTPQKLDQEPSNQNSSTNNKLTSAKLFSKTDSSSKQSGNVEGDQIKQDNQKIQYQQKQKPSQDSLSSQQTCGQQQIYSAQTATQTQFNHQSKFFTLEQPILQLNNQTIFIRGKNGRGYQGINNYKNSVRIPTIQEWFQSLSKDDKILCLTIVDFTLVNSIVRMQQRLNKKGQGKFSLVTKLLKQTINAASGNGSQPSKYQSQLVQDVKFSSIKNFIKDDKDKIAQQAKQCHEKDLLDLVRLTHTKVSTNLKNQQEVTDFLMEDQDLNTLTVAQTLVQDPVKFYQLVQAIVGNNFLKVPLEINWDDQKMFFIVKTPTWFVPSAYNSLAYWVIFLFEISLWVHYEAYVKSRFMINKTTLDPKLFLSKQGQLINVKNELQSYWSQIQEKSKQNHTILKDIGSEVFKRSKLLQLNQPQEASANEDFLSLSQLNGGLIQVRTTAPPILNSESKIIEALQQNREPEMFMNDLCLFSLSRVGSQLNKLEKILVDVLRDKLEENERNQKILSNKKNQKKKNKKKTQKQDQTSNRIDNEIEKDNLEEKKENLQESESEHLLTQIQEEEEEDNIYDQYYCKDLDELSIALLVQQSQHHIQPRNNDLLDELLRDEGPVQNKLEQKVQIIQKIMKIPSVKPIKEYLNYQITNEDQKYELNDHAYENQIHQLIHEDEEKEQNKEEQSANSDSTEDLNQQEHHHLSEIKMNQTIESPSQKLDTLDYNIIERLKQSEFSAGSVGYMSSDRFDEDDSKKASINHDIKSFIEERKNQVIKNQSTTKKKNNTKSFMSSQKELSIQNDLNKSLDDSINNFQIIRSNKNFNNSASQNNNNNSSKQQQQQNQQQTQNQQISKNKKKKRSKAVLPQLAQQYSSNNDSLKDQSQKLNEFMRNIVQVKEPVEVQEIQKPFQKIEKQVSKIIPEKEQTTQQVIPNYEIRTKLQVQNNTNQTASTQTQKDKPIYIRKTNRHEPIPNTLDNSIILNQQQNITIQPAEIKEQEIIKPVRTNQLNKSHDVAKKSKQKQQQQHQRFQNFINMKDPLDKSQDNQKIQLNKEKSKKSNHKNSHQHQLKNNKKKMTNTQNSTQASGLITPQEYPSNNSVQQHQFNAPYGMPNQMVNTMPEHQMYQNGYMQPQMPYQPDGFNDIFRNIQSQQGIQYLQQLIHQAIQQNQFNFQDRSQNFYDSPNFPQSPDEYQHQQDDYERKNALIAGFYETLSQQLESLMNTIENKLDSVAKERISAINLLEKLINENLKPQNNQAFQIKMYGSMASKLAIEQSDVDLAVVGLEFQGIRELQIKEMRVLFERLQESLKYLKKSSILFIESATIPVIKLSIDLEELSISHQDGIEIEIDPQMRNLGIDITFEDQSLSLFYGPEGQRVNLGIQCIQYIQDLCYQQPFLKPIVLFMKKLLQNSNLNQPFYGGINSYSLVLMVSAFLNKFGNYSTPSQSLFEFLRYFGYYFDAETVMIDNQDFIKTMCPMIDPMTILDPLNKANNTTRSAFRIREIQEVFKRVFEYMNSKLLEVNDVSVAQCESDMQQDPQELLMGALSTKIGNVIRDVLEREDIDHQQ